VPNTDVARAMLQTLLDRFKLNEHREMKEMPVHAQVAAKNKPPTHPEFRS
jgi:uncharacterized protein (TIGR03435 family)